MNSKEWTQAPFKYAFVGHLLAGGVLLILTLILVSISAFLLGQKLPNTGLLIACLLFAEFVTQFITTCSDRRLERKRKRSTTGSVMNTVFRVSVRCLLFFLVSLLLSGISYTTAIIVACVFVVSVFEAVLTKSWRDGLSDEEVRIAIRQTAIAASEMFKK